MSDEMIKVHIQREDPGCNREVWIETYHVPRDRGRRVLDLLEYIQEEVDPTLGWRTHICRDTCCDACWLMVNGNKRMACATVLKENEDSIKLEPLPKYALIRDLIVDFSTENS